MHSIFSLPIILAFAIYPFHYVHSNDTIAAISVGGLVLKKTDAIRMKDEKLIISPKKIRVTYEFLNESAQPIETLVAFPMPEIGANLYDNSARFSDFKVIVAGKNVPYKTETKALFGEIDITDELVAHKVPLDDFPSLEKLPEPTRKWLVEKEYFNERNPDTDLNPGYDLKRTYFWNQIFPPGRTIQIEHEYSPQLGSNSVGALNLGKSWKSFFSTNNPDFSECMIGSKTSDRKEYCLEQNAGYNRRDAKLFAYHGAYIPFDREQLEERN
jgi:hypothetical protein